MSGGRVDFKAKLKAAGTERMTMLEQSLERVKKHFDDPKVVYDASCIHCQIHRGLSDLRRVGYKSTAAVHFNETSFSSSFSPSPSYKVANSVKTVLAGAGFRYRRPKSDRLLASNQHGGERF